MIETGQSAIQILAGRVVHAFLSLIYYPAVDFYGAPIPMLTFVAGTLFLVGLVIALLNTRRPSYLLLNGYFWSVTIAIGVFSIPPTADSYRMLGALPAAEIMVAMALNYILETMGLGWEKSKRAYTVITMLTIFSLLVSNLWTYYFDFAGRCLYGGDSQTRFASYLGNYVRDLPRETNIYLLSDDTYRYGTHLSVDFLSGKRVITNFDSAIETLHPVSNEIVIASPNRLEELRVWIRTQPGGELDYRYDCEKLILLSYQVP
jgi:hypothetical protein